MMPFEIKIRDAVPLFADYAFAQPVNWAICEGEQWAVVGPNGAGKTLLTDLLQGKIALGHGRVEICRAGDVPVYQLIRAMQFRDIYSLMDVRNTYYQQRWNASDREETALVGALFTALPQAEVAKYLRLFNLEHCIDKHIVSLSSGELRKALIIRALVSKPRLLILDNPFTGLDASSRESLNAMLAQLSRMEGLQIVFVVADVIDLPPWVDKILPIKDRKILPVCSLAEFLADELLQERLFPELGSVLEGVAGCHCGLDPQPPANQSNDDYTTVFQLDDVHVRYGDNIILNNLNWQVNKGEKWALLGDNGSGKSTILSLVYADNPQAYANKITLFGQQRGGGESIWDIKRRIGYLNSDLHTCYLKDIPAVDVVTSGFFDSIGSYKKGNAEQCAKALEWLEVFHAEHLATRSFVKMSFGEQRLVLLARAFVKDPPVLILDEPLHGLDAGKKRLAQQIIETFCARPDKTLIYVTHYREEIPACVTLFKQVSKIPSHAPMRITSSSNSVG
ncbi:molybdenum transport ATP-binding protein modF [Candidatus Symbiothrix dinenymphae]|nr:molybdenum transport ATP-binding protein modF [Candidatus Symbiothrix dinenymphae]